MPAVWFGYDLDVLIGRDAEISMLRSLLERAATGRSQVLVVTGDAGIGKSALLEYAGQLSVGTVLSTSGVEDEADLGYVHLADLLRGAQSRLADLPVSHHRALAGVLALGPAAAADRFALAAGALSLIGLLAETGPVTILVDDVQWIDPASLQVITFVAHRLDAEGVVLLFGLRSGYERIAGLDRFPRVALGGLDAEAARELVTEAGLSASESALSRVLAEAGGNPLALLALPRLLNADELALWTQGLDPLPIDSLLEQAFCGGLRQLPASTREALILLAVLGRAPRQMLVKALAANGQQITELEPAECAGLVALGPDGPRFRHPLIRAAVFQISLPQHRRQAHLRAAAALQDSGLPNALEHQAWHLVAAGGMAEEALAAQLEAAAWAEFTADSFAVAGNLFLRSAELTPAGGPAARRLVNAAKSIRLSGGVGESYELLCRVLTLTDDPELTRAVRHSMYRISMWRAPTVAGRDALLRLAEEAASVDPGQAIAMLADAALASVEIGDLARARQVSERAIQLTSADRRQPPLGVVGIRAMVLGLCGEAVNVRALLDPRTAEIAAIDPLGSEMADQLSLVISLARLCSEDTDRAAELLERAVAGARERSAIGPLPFRLGRLAWVYLWRGRWSAARASAHEALQLVESTGWANERPSSLATLARIEAVMGLAEECRQHVAESVEGAERMGGRPYIAYAHAALGLLELTQGRYLSAIENLLVLDDLAQDSGLHDTPVLWWSSDLIEAYTHYGLPDEAHRVLVRLERSVADHPIPTAAAVAARSRALLEPENALEHLSQALDWHARAPMPFEEARTRLFLGSVLRRRRQRAESRPHLQASLATFERLGAPDWAARARAELQASGVRQRASEQPVAGFSSLTNQELQVALTVARGLSNREVADQMFLSIKTVEFHLSHVYDKLGIHRRSQLIMLAAAQGQPDVARGDAAR